MHFCPTSVPILYPSLILQVDQTGWTRSGPSVTVSAEYRSRYEVVCNLPAERSYTIAISNDQRSTSISEALFLTYDSQCFVCSISNDSQSATCTLKVACCLFRKLMILPFLFLLFISKTSKSEAGRWAWISHCCYHCNILFTSCNKIFFTWISLYCYYCCCRRRRFNIFAWLQPRTCFIGGMCFLENQKNPADSCLACQPSKSQTSWTQANGQCLCTPVNFLCRRTATFIYWYRV